MELDLEEVPHSRDVTLVDIQTKRPLYRITEFILTMFKNKPMIVSRLSEVAEKEEDLAEIKRGWFSEYITFESDGVRLKANKFFSVGAFQGHYSFTGPDGRTRYRWELEVQGSKLTTDDQARTLIAQYTEERRNLLGLGAVKTLPRLVVMQAGMDMVDMVVITLAYIEKKREEVKIATMAAVAS